MRTHPTLPTAGRRQLLAAAAVLAVALPLVGCDALGNDGDGNDTPRTTAGEPAASRGAEPRRAASPALVTLDPANVVVRQTVAMPDSPRDTVEFGVQSLVVEGEVMTLRLTVVPHFQSVSASETLNLYEIAGKRTLQPFLIDLPHLKRYDVVRGDNGSSFASDLHTTRTVNNSPMSAYYVFAAPEDELSTVDVWVSDWWPAFNDVPVQR